MDPLLDYNITEIKCKDRKSYARDSHGFELESNYFQNPSSDEESSSDAGSFTLSLGRKNNKSSQQQLSKQRHTVAMLPSATRSGRPLHHSPSPSKVSPVKITTNPKKRLTFEVDSTEDDQKTVKDETVSDSEEEEEKDHVAVTKEVLPGSYTAGGVVPSPRHSMAYKKKSRSFDLGDFSDSSSETDEDVAGIKRSLFVRPAGSDTLMCLPKLSEYIKPRQKSTVTTKKQTQAPVAHHQENDKRKRHNLNNTVVPANAKKRRKKIRIEPVTEETIVEIPEEDETCRAVRTQQNPKLTKKRSTSSAAIKQSNKQRPGSPRDVKQQRQKLVAKRSSALRQSTMSPVSDSSQKSFAVLQNTTTKIIDSIYNNDLEEDMVAEVEQSVQRGKGRPSISFTSKGEEIRRVQSNMKKKQALDPLVSQQAKKQRLTDKVVDIKKHFHRSAISSLHHEEMLVSEGEQQKKKTKEAAQKPPTVHKSKGRNNKEKRKDASRNAKRKKLIDESKSRYHDQDYMHIPVARAEPDTLDNTLRRSARTRVPVINHLLGEQLIYEASASGGMVVKEVIRPATSAYQLLTKPPRRQSSTNTTQPFKSNSRVQEAKKKRRNYRESSVDDTDTEQHADEMVDDDAKSFKSNSRVKEAKKKRHNYQESSVDDTDTEQHADEMVDDDAKTFKSNSRMQEAKKKRHNYRESSVDDTEQRADKMAGGDTKPLKSSSRVLQEAKKGTKKHKHRELIVDDTEQRANEMAGEEEDIKNISSLLVSPRRNETFGNSLMKSMFETTSSLATELVEITNDDGTTRPPVEVVKPLQSLRLCNASGLSVTPNDPFIMAILSRQKNVNFGVAVLNKMGEKGEQYTDDSSVYFFLISGEIIVKIGDLELHPPVWSRIFVPEGISYTLKNLQHTPAVLVYVVIKPNKDHV